MTAVYLMVAILVVAVVLWRAHTSVDGALVAEWATAHGITLTPANRPMVWRYLHSARVLRAWGVVIGLGLPALIGAVLDTEVLKDVLGPLAFAGYLAGAVVAEVALLRPADERRIAVLVRRDLDDYLPHRILVAHWVVAALSVVAGVGVVAVTSGDPAPSRTGATVVGTVAVVVAVAVPRLGLWLVHRPQRFTEPDLVAADDAIRSQSVHSVAGSGLAMLLLCLGTLFIWLAQSGVDVLRWTTWLPGVGCWVASVCACLYYGHRAWRVRHESPPSGRAVILEVDPRSAVPPYEQLRQQATALVRAGVLQPGTRLPAIRQLANDLGLASGTVARAYRELENDGVVTTKGRHGTVVADRDADAPATPRALIKSARRFAADARRHGAGVDDAIAVLRAAYAAEATE